MRFDDSLETVLSAEMSTPFGAQSTWRQLVDLIGRRRVPPSASALAKLRAIRDQVPSPVRAASARATAFADPPAGLVQLFAEDEASIAAPVLRTARLRADEWIAMLPVMAPAVRSLLRHRRDLPPEVERGLETFGSVDFVLSVREGMPSESVELAGDAPVEISTDPVGIDAVPSATPMVNPIAREAVAGDETAPDGKPVADDPETTFVSFASVARGLPVVAEALRQNDGEGERHEPSDRVAGEMDGPAGNVVHLADMATLQPPPAEAATGMFQIAELVARIDAYRRQREEAPDAPLLPSEIQPALFEFESIPASSFRFETDASGVVRWVEGAARAPLIGISLEMAVPTGGSQVDGVAAGAFRRRAGFADARLVVDGTSEAAGHWRITGIPVFDRYSGRFTGYRGSARRPRPDESAVPVARQNPASDALRQLVHELRTPTNAIAGFAEMIATQMLGPVPQGYRTHATAILQQAGDLLTAIDDIDMAARIESNALDLRPAKVPLTPLLRRVAADLSPLATLRGTMLDLHVDERDLAIAGDDRAVERLIGRLMATLVSSGSKGERIGIGATLDNDGMIVLAFDRPQALASYVGDALLAIDAETEADLAGAPLLGTGFALRLVRNLASELRGGLTFGDKILTLRLPAAVIEDVEQVSSN